MKRPPRLGSQFEALEDRALPATFGVPWADPEHLTLSLPTDGTQTPLGADSLNRLLASTGNSKAAELAILRAFQTWAANANINIGLVSDGNQPLGTVGAVQGDSRFGDIRLAAALLSPDSVANALPFSWTGTTLSGDVMFNSAMPFGVGNSSSFYDLYSVALHEAGHVFGMDHSTDPASVMNEDYAYHTGLSASDIANLQALYGARRPDPADTANGNNSLATAAALPKTSSGQLLATGELIKNGEADYYKFSTPLLTATLSSVTVRLKAEGLSLLTAQVTVYDAWGRVVATAKSIDPTNNDLTLSFTPGLLGGNYTIKVQGARGDVFDVGSYKLAVDFLSLGSVLAPITTTVAAVADGGLTALLSNALGVQSNTTGSDARFDAIYRGVMANANDVDSFRFHTNKFAAGTPVTLDVMVWGLDANPVDAAVRVYDQNKNPVAFEILSNDRGLFSVQVLNAVAGQDYYVQVFVRQGAKQTSGSYFFAADFNQAPPMVYNSVAAGVVNPGTTTSADTLTLTEAGVYQFALTGLSLTGDTVTMSVYDASGNLVFTLTAGAGQPLVTATKYLKAGKYTVTYSGSSANSLPVGYGLFIAELSDPVGPYMPGTSTSTTTSGSTQSSSPPPSSSYTYSGSSTYQSSGYPYSY